MIALSPLGGRLSARLGVRALMTLGMALGTVGLIVLAQVGTSTGYALLFPGYLLFGTALGCVYAPMSTAAMTAMPKAKAGVAAGVLAMNRVLAGAITLAATGAVFQVVLDDDLHAARVEPAAFTSALSASMWVLVGLCAVGTVLTWAFVRASGDTTVAPPPDAPALPPAVRLTQAARAWSASSAAAAAGPGSARPRRCAA